MIIVTDSTSLLAFFEEKPPMDKQWGKRFSYHG